MSLYRCISRRASQVLVVLERDVFSVLGVSISLCEAEIDDIHIMLSLANSYQEVVRLNVSVQEQTGVDVLDSLNLRGKVWICLTIWSASISTVFNENLRLH